MKGSNIKDFLLSIEDQELDPSIVRDLLRTLEIFCSGMQLSFEEFLEPLRGTSKLSTLAFVIRLFSGVVEMCSVSDGRNEFEMSEMVQSIKSLREELDDENNESNTRITQLTRKLCQLTRDQTEWREKLENAKYPKDVREVADKMLRAEIHLVNTFQTLTDNEDHLREKFMMQPKLSAEYKNLLHKATDLDWKNLKMLVMTKTAKGAEASKKLTDIMVQEIVEKSQKIMQTDYQIIFEQSRSTTQRSILEKLMAQIATTNMRVEEMIAEHRRSSRKLKEYNEETAICKSRNIQMNVGLTLRLEKFTQKFHVKLELLKIAEHRGCLLRALEIQYCQRQNEVSKVEQKYNGKFGQIRAEMFKGNQEKMKRMLRVLKGPLDENIRIQRMILGTILVERERLDKLPPLLNEIIRKDNACMVKGLLKKQGQMQITRLKCNSLALVHKQLIESKKHELFVASCKMKIEDVYSIRRRRQQRQKKLDRTMKDLKPKLQAANEVKKIELKWRDKLQNDMKLYIKQREAYLGHLSRTKTSYKTRLKAIKQKYLELAELEDSIVKKRDQLLNARKEVTAKEISVSRMDIIQTEERKPWDAKLESLSVMITGMKDAFHELNSQQKKLGAEKKLKKFNQRLFLENSDEAKAMQEELANLRQKERLDRDALKTLRETIEAKAEEQRKAAMAKTEQDQERIKLMTDCAELQKFIAKTKSRSTRAKKIVTRYHMNEDLQ